MPIMLRAAFATAVFTLAVSTAADGALAMPPAMPSLSGAANTDLIARIAIMCGRGGCGPVFTKRVQHPPAGFVQRAVPLAVPKMNGTLPVGQSK